MDFKQLRAFVMVAQELNFTRAAARLHTSQQNLSRQIAALERQWGLRLLERDHHGVRLTPTGRLILPEAEHTLACVARLTGTLQAARTGARVLRLGTLDWARGAQLSAAAVEAFQRAEPSVDLHFDPLPWPQQPQALLSGQIDVGFSFGAPHLDYADGVSSAALFDDPVGYALLSSRHPLAARTSVRAPELQQLPLSIVPRPMFPALHDHLMAGLAQAGLRPQLAESGPSFAAALQLMAAGAGWVLASRSVAEAPPVGTVALRIEQLDIAGLVAVLWRHEEAHPLARAFVTAAQQVDTRLHA